jgi:ribonuclease E
MSEASGTATEPPAEPSEIGWTELDDISQIEELAGAGPLTDEGGDEREYTFEEADEATLAELGLRDGSAPTEAGEEPATEEPKPRRRTRTRTAEPKAAAAVTSEDAAPKPARRSRPRKASSEEAGSSEAVEAKPAAKPRTRRTRATASATEPASGQEPEAAKPARRTRTRKPAAAASTEDAAGGEGAEEGIWQRFRSARRGGGSSAS